MEYNIRFDGPPGPKAGRFVEVENEKGSSVNAGEWIGPDDDGSWILRIRPEHELQSRLATVEADLELCKKWLRDCHKSKAKIGDRCLALESERDRLKAENERLLRCLADYPAGNQTEPDVKAALREVDGGKV